MIILSVQISVFFMNLVLLRIQIVGINFRKTNRHQKSQNENITERIQQN
jgi:hypothetical protein